MRFIGKKLATGALAVCLLFGGGTAAFAQQFAVESPPSMSDTTDQSDKAKSGATIEKFKHRKHAMKKYSDRISKILGMSNEELMEEIKAGKSLVEIAKKRGISEDQLIEKLKDSMTEDLRKMVNKKRSDAKSWSNQVEED